MRRKKRIRCYFGVVIFFTFLGYYKYQSKKLDDWPILNKTRSTWNTTRVTDSVIHRSTDRIANNGTQPTVVTVNKNTTTHGYIDKENLNISSLLQYVSNVSFFLAVTIAS